MEINEFLKKALEPCAGLRRGQSFMNTLSFVRPCMVQRLIQLNMDPFYSDSKLWLAVEWVRDNWEANKQA
jgi:hypothetical protein